jgi:hypothetical protein
MIEKLRGIKLVIDNSLCAIQRAQRARIAGDELALCIHLLEMIDYYYPIEDLGDLSNLQPDSRLMGGMTTAIDAVVHRALKNTKKMIESEINECQIALGILPSGPLPTQCPSLDYDGYCTDGHGRETCPHVCGSGDCMVK